MLIKAIRHVSISKDDSKIASSSADSTVRIWDAKTNLLLGTLKGHTKEVWCTDFNQDGKRIISGG